MTTPPAQPKIYRIVHVDRLQPIVATGAMLSDAQMQLRQPAGTNIGIDKIKQRRLTIPVDCHLNTAVGEFVPFYFCPRSIMLYVIHRGNHPDLAYQGGQRSIIHLEADLQRVVAWAQQNSVRWAFTSSNAGAYYTQHYKDLAQLPLLNWPAIANTDFRSDDVKEAKQAEFLVYRAFPWTLIDRIGVISAAVRTQVYAALATSAHRPVVDVRPDWYY